VFRDYSDRARRDQVFNGMLNKRRSWERSFEIRRVDMTHWQIIVPGWGTVYGRGTRAQANEVARLRARPNREPEVKLVADPDVNIEWRELTTVLKEMQ
jgi:hypothetical protein